MSAEPITIGLTRHCERGEAPLEPDAQRPRSAGSLRRGACHRTARLRAGPLAPCNDGDAKLAPADWDRIRLVVFDVDGTLYNQRRLRLHMLRDVMVHAAKTRSLDVPLLIRAYRLIRERIAEREVADFETALIAETAVATRLPASEIHAVVDEWIERRPLPYLAACIYPGVAALFSGLRRHGKIIGVLSDYPAAAKLDALSLEADHVLCAGDHGIGFLKPNPRGLQVMMETVRATPGETVLIGDRADRDGAAARRAGAWPLIRSAKAVDSWQIFAQFDDPLFANFLPPRLQR
jgi:FMN phosphatase YigB (HAD superfamily)